MNLQFNNANTIIQRKTRYSAVPVQPIISRLPNQPNQPTSTNLHIKTDNTIVQNSMQFNMLGRLSNNGKCLGCNKKQ